jgi:hypothetical protein
MKTISLSEFLRRALTERGYDYDIIRRQEHYALVVWDNGTDCVVWEVTPHYVYELLFPTREEAYAFATDYEAVANANMWYEYPIEEVIEG